MQSLMQSTKKSHRIIVILLASVAVLLSTTFAPNAHAAPNLPVASSAGCVGTRPALYIYQHANYQGLVSTLQRPNCGDCDGFGYQHIKLDYWQMTNISSLSIADNTCNYVKLYASNAWATGTYVCAEGYLNFSFVGNQGFLGGCNDRTVNITVLRR